VETAVDSCIVSLQRWKNNGRDVSKDGFLSRRNENHQEMVTRMEAKTDINLKEKKEELMARLEAKIKAEINTNNEKFEVLRSTVVSWMDIHEARTKAIQEEIIAKIDAHQGRMGTSVNAWRKETMACQEVTEACLESKEPTSVSTEVVNRDEFRAIVLRREPCSMQTRYWVTTSKQTTKQHLMLGIRF
jgi:hypothetical protein